MKVERHYIVRSWGLSRYGSGEADPVVLPQFGVSMPIVDHVLHVVLMIAEAVKKTLGGSVPLITLDMIEQSAAKHGAMVRLLPNPSEPNLHSPHR